ncbi:MAG: ABC transporter permease [Bacteroidetes bacterium]|nr:ABC transporter permease [Bacteroidota bacterium]
MNSSTNLPEVIYTPESQLRRPGMLIRNMFADIKNSKELAWRLMVRNIAGMYRQSLIGIGWAFIMPVITTMTWIFLNGTGIVKLDKTPIPYALYTFSGTLLWQIFVDALNSPIREVARSRAMLTKINFPKEAIIISGIGEVLFNASIRLLLIIPVLFIFKINPGFTAIFTLFGVIVLVIAGVSLGLFLTPLGTLYLDIGRGLMLITTFWMYITPVVFPIKTEGFAGFIFRYNPMTYLIMTTRDLITGQPLVFLPQFFIVLAGILVLFFIACILYRIAMPHLISRIGA